MNMTVTSPFEISDIPVVEVLTTATNASEYGYCLGGYNAGPHLVVAGHAPIADAVYDRIIALPTIGWMHGTLTLIVLNALEETSLLSEVSGNDKRVDDIHFLPYHLDGDHHAAAATEGYWSTLRVCATLGMISGLGIPVLRQDI